LQPLVVARNLLPKQQCPILFSHFSLSAFFKNLQNTGVCCLVKILSFQIKLKKYAKKIEPLIILAVLRRSV